MKSFLKQAFGVKVLVTGIVLIVVGQATSIVVLWNTYGKAGQCFDDNARCSLGVEQFASKAATGMVYAGLVLVAIGVIVLVITQIKKNR